MKMKKTLVIISSFLCAAAAILSSGCGSNAEYVEAGGSRSLISTDKINIADWNKAADALVNSMLSSSAFEKLKKPAILQVSRIINRTSQRIDTDLLTKRITITLNNSGQAIVKSTDKYSTELAEYNRFMGGKSTLPTADVTLSGKIIEDRESVGRDREVTYTFQMSLNVDGLQVWEDQKQIAKQETKSLF